MAKGENSFSENLFSASQPEAGSVSPNPDQTGGTADGLDCRRCREAFETAAHDLKTPTSIVSGYVELMLSEKLGPLTSRQRTALREMQDGIGRLRGFIRNFLVLSNFKNSPVELQVSTADLNKCLGEIAQLWFPSFERAGIALFFSPDNQLPLFSFDHYKVQHVVSNLLDNALKVSSAGGTVWMTAELHLWERRSRQDSARLGSERRGTRPSVPNTVRVTVADSGPGVAAEFHQEIFQEYFRVNQESDGHGLGLAIAQRLVTQFGGKIWVESEPGAGAKFAFLLPLNPIG